MTYEEEQIKYAEELKKVTREIKGLNSLLEDPQTADDKIMELLTKSSAIHQYTTQYELRYEVARLKQLFERDYRNKMSRKKELERLLSQSPSERKTENVKRKIGEGAEFIASITPQHVTGRVYRVENGDGCAKFCIWFMIIDALILFIYYLCTEVH